MTSRGIFFCTRPWGVEAQEWVSFVEGFITYTTIGLRGQVCVSSVAVGFIYFYVSYTTIWPGGAGMCFFC